LSGSDELESFISEIGKCIGLDAYALIKVGKTLDVIKSYKIKEVLIPEDEQRKFLGAILAKLPESLETLLSNINLNGRFFGIFTIEGISKNYLYIYDGESKTLGVIVSSSNFDEINRNLLTVSKKMETEKATQVELSMELKKTLDGVVKVSEQQKEIILWLKKLIDAMDKLSEKMTILKDFVERKY